MRFLHECYEQVDRWEGSKKTGCYLLLRNVESQDILTECATPAISNKHLLTCWCGGISKEIMGHSYQGRLLSSEMSVGNI